MSQRQILKTPTRHGGIHITLKPDPEQRERLVQAIKDARATLQTKLKEYGDSDAGQRDRENYSPFDDEPVVTEEWQAVTLAQYALDDARNHLKEYDTAEAMRRRHEREGRR